MNRDNQLKYQNTDNHFGLQQIDTIIVQYIKNSILPTLQSQSLLDIPFLPASSQRWIQAQKYSILRDQRGQIECPIMIYKRQQVQPSSKITIPVLNPANPPLIHPIRRKAINKGSYSKTVFKTQYMVIPQYVTINYSLKAWTNYISQANLIIQNFNFFNKTYWGNGNIKFMTTIKSIGESNQISDESQRVIMTDIDIEVQAYIIPLINKTKLIKELQQANKIKIQEIPLISNIYNKDIDTIKLSTQQYYKNKRYR